MSIQPLANPSNPLPWMERANCTGHNPELWFNPTHGVHADAWREPRTICRSCPVVTQCLSMALENEGGLETRYGMYGGLSPEERAAVDPNRRMVS